MRMLSLMVGAALGAIAFPHSAQAQSRDGGGYVDIYWEEEPQPEEQAPAVAPPPTPAIVIPPPPPRPPLPPRENIYSFEDKALDTVTSKDLEPFGSDAAFRAYLKRLEKVKDKRDYHWAGAAKPILIAASMQDETEGEVCLNPEDCPAEADNGQKMLVVTGSRIPSAVTSITNVQAVGVDEGDIIKQIGDYFLILRDGRIFAVNTKTMQLTDRVNVYRPLAAGTKKRYRWEDDFEGADWYDEMLVQDDHILITAYSYQDNATEFSIFKLDQASGKVSPQGVFLISSDDYYDSDNYATRIVGDRLVMYTPYSVEQFEDREDRPVIRRWMSSADREKYEDENDGELPGKPLFDARNLYKPVLRTGEPTIHTISVCPLGAYQPGADLRCRTTGFVGPEWAKMYVSPENVYLWNSYGYEESDPWRQDSCKTEQLATMPKRRDVIPAALYRMNVRTGETGVAGVSGGVIDQFSMEEQGDRFYALTPWATVRCEYDDYENQNYVEHFNLMALRDDDFDTRFEAVADRAFTPLPALPIGNIDTIENRFVGDWLIYGGRKTLDRWSDAPDAENVKNAASNAAIAVPIARPKAAQTVPVGHSIVRLERLGNDAVINGYLKEDGLNVSLLKLGKQPQISSTAFLPNRFESESRSHAFNGITDIDGSGVMGIPTVEKVENSNRYNWWSGKSDLSFLTLDAQGRLAIAGELEGKNEDEVKEHETYKCEVSCIDWYGNARPIFTKGRIFGLMGTALVEARIRLGRIEEVQRLDLTSPIGTASSIKVVETAAPAAN